MCCLNIYPVWAIPNMTFGKKDSGRYSVNIMNDVVSTIKTTTCRYQVRAQNLWYHRKGLIIRNTHAKYESKKCGISVTG